MKAVIYNSATGKILRTVTGSPRSMRASLAALADGEASISVAADVDVRGKAVADGALVDATPDEATALRNLRIERARRLAEHVDKFTPLRIETLTDAQRDELRAYRQALLDITDGDPFDPQWPARPAFT